MPVIERFEDIESWKRARVVTNKIYQLSSTGGFSRDYGLRDQIRKSSVSVMSNVPRDLGDGNRVLIS
jgi:four helix bundle protein